jgi:hypothetical protein
LKTQNAVPKLEKVLEQQNFNGKLQFAKSKIVANSKVLLLKYLPNFALKLSLIVSKHFLSLSEN